MKLYVYNIPMLSMFLVPGENRESADIAIKEYFKKNYKPGVEPRFVKEIPVKVGEVIKVN